MERKVRHFQEELDELKGRLLEMGGLAEDRVRLAVRGLVERDGTLVDRVLTGDAAINQLHIEIDKAAEKARLEKLAAKVEAEIANARGKLSNPAFVEKAPPALVGQEKKRLAEKEAELAQIRAQLAKLA